MQTFIYSYLNFPEIESPVDYIGKTLKKDNNL